MIPRLVLFLPDQISNSLLVLEQYIESQWVISKIRRMKAVSLCSKHFWSMRERLSEKQKSKLFLQPQGLFYICWVESKTEFLSYVRLSLKSCLSLAKTTLDLKSIANCYWTASKKFLCRSVQKYLWIFIIFFENIGDKEICLVYKLWGQISLYALFFFKSY